MPGRFTSLLCMVLATSACGSLPMRVAPLEPAEPFVAAEPAAEAIRKETREEMSGTQAQENQALAHQPGLDVPVPEVRNGNDRLFARALELLDAGNLESAEMMLGEITRDQPELAGPWVNLGLISDARGDAQAASAAMLSALEANPHNCDALNWLGVASREAGEFEAAEQYYRRCLDAHPGYLAARLNLGILYELYLGRFAEALAAYQDYQLARAEPDARVNGWMIDLERRAAALAQR